MQRSTVRVVQAEQDRQAPPVLPRPGAVEEGGAEEHDAVRVGRGGVVGDEPALGGGGDADDAAVARPALGEQRDLRVGQVALAGRNFRGPLGLDVWGRIDMWNWNRVGPRRLWFWFRFRF